MCENVWLLVGLGNPGKKYDVTRHNIGFWVIDDIARRFNGKWQRGNYGLTGTIGIGDASVTLLKPLTWMNMSGIAVSESIEQLGIGLSRLFVVCDDVALPDGRIRIRTQGSSGGHRGLASLIDYLGSTAFVRLRIGVGSSRDTSTELSDFVLEKPSSDAMTIYRKAVMRACDAIVVSMEKGIQTAMTEYNRAASDIETSSGSGDSTELNTGGDA